MSIQYSGVLFFFTIERRARGGRDRVLKVGGMMEKKEEKREERGEKERGKANQEEQRYKFPTDPTHGCYPLSARESAISGRWWVESGCCSPQTRGVIRRHVMIVIVDITVFS